MADGAVETRAAGYLAAFCNAGAVEVQAPLLLSADTLLDLYGEDIRGRAYVTSDALRGEQMLRPDFTVPVVERHMEQGADPARYAYAGPVFRKQEEHPDRAHEYLQVGYELFAREDPAQADAEVFALFHAQLADLPVRAAAGDIGILAAAVQGLQTSSARRAALMRHIWRPRRFRVLLDRYAGRGPARDRSDLLNATDPWADAAPQIGLRSQSEIDARLAALRADRDVAPVSDEEIHLLDTLMSVRETCAFALQHLRDLSVDLPAIAPAVDRLAARLDALDARGIDPANLDFEASYGRTSMEYYDGFVFGFHATAHPHWPPIATGGRYDALTARLGPERPIPAVGGVLRPDLILDLEGTS